MLKKARNFLIIIFSMAIAAVSLCLIAFGGNVKYTVAAESNDIRERYIVGQVIDFSDCTVTAGDESYPVTDVTTAYPDGRISNAMSFKTEQAGVYSVSLKAQSGNEVFVCEKKITVCDYMYSVGNTEKSSAVYGTYEKYGSDKPGIILSLQKGDSFYFNKVIDFNDKTSLDPLLRLFVTPDTIGVADAQTIVLKFTDAYDSSNYVEVEMRNVSYMGSWADIATYVAASSAEQTPTGLGSDGNPRSDIYGFTEFFSMTGKPDGELLGEDTFSLFFDYAEKQVFCGGGMIIDLDEPAYFSKLWKGFTHGEAFLSIRGERFQSSYLNMVLFDIDGNDLSVNEIENDVPPRLTVDLEGYDKSELPGAIVGEEYKIFHAESVSAYDEKLNVNTRVYYNYGSDNQVDCSIVNGAFVPAREGLYTIEYSAKDLFGNITKQLLHITAEISDGLQFETEGAVSGVINAGQKIKLFDDVTYSGQSGKVTVYAVAESGDNVYRADENYTICPEYSGKYIVTVYCSDYVSVREEKFEFEVQPSSVPVFTEDVILPQFMIKGCTYLLPEMDGYEYSKGFPEKITAEISVIEDGGAEQLLQNSEYTVRAENSVKIIYHAQIGGGERTEKTYEIKVVDVGYGGALDSGSYFYPVSGECLTQAAEDGVRLSASGADAGVRFINAVNQNFNLNFAVNSEKNNFSAVEVRLTDAARPQSYLSFKFTKSGEYSTFTLNDKISVGTESSFSLTSDFIIMLDTDNKTVTPNRTNYLLVETFADGTPFNGFTGKTAYLDIILTGVTADSEIIIHSIQNHYFSDSEADTFAPQVIFNKVSGDRELGSTIVLEPAFAFDVLDPKVDFSLTVTSPSGDFVKATDGTLLDGTCDTAVQYEIKLDQYGDYTILYQAEDSSGRRIKHTFGVTVTDTEKPKITLGTKTTSGSVGKNIKTADYSCSDNITAASEIKSFVYVLRPDGIMQTVSGNSFYADIKGEYSVIYAAFDSAGNMAVESYIVDIR